MHAPARARICIQLLSQENWYYVQEICIQSPYFLEFFEFPPLNCSHIDHAEQNKLRPYIVPAPCLCAGERGSTFNRSIAWLALSCTVQLNQANFITVMHRFPMLILAESARSIVHIRVWKHCENNCTHLYFFHLQIVPAC